MRLLYPLAFPAPRVLPPLVASPLVLFVEVALGFGVLGMAQAFVELEAQDEVRNLAQRSSQAAKDIKDLITNSSNAVGQGVQLVNRAGESLNDILKSINEVAAIVAEEAFDYLDGPVTRVAGPDVPGVPYNHVLEEWFMVNPEKIADSVRKLAAY